MNKKFLYTMIFAATTLALLLIFRNQIWDKTNLYPADQITIYLRDGSLYFLLLRIFFVGHFSWGLYLYWTTKKAIYCWLPTLFYAGFMLLESVIVTLHYYDYQNAGLISKTESAYFLFRTIPEAFVTVILAGFIYWLINSKHLGFNRSQVES